MSLKKYAFMLDKFRRDIKTPKQRYPLAEDMSSQDLGQYYFVFSEERVASGADQPLINKFDENGIPINKTYLDVTDKDHVYFPISIGQLGLAVFHTYLKTGKELDKNRFLKFAEWFADSKNFDEDDTLGIRWLTDVSLPQYKNKGPWQSAFSQSRGISILLRAYQLTGEKIYLDIAEKALKSFLISYEDGGVTAFTPWGPFYEEYTSTEPVLVLNGMIFALCGIYDFVRACPDNKVAKEIFEQGIKTLEKILPEYNMGFWSKYNLCSAEWYPKTDPATIGYQRLHINQLWVLYHITNNKLFKQYADIFTKQDRLINYLKMYHIKFQALKKIGRL
jgi:heparosan-N-sulfate-glucuronate 5-epimerase